MVWPSREEILSAEERMNLIARSPTILEGDDTSFGKWHANHFAPHILPLIRPATSGKVSPTEGHRANGRGGSTTSKKGTPLVTNGRGQGFGGSNASSTSSTKTISPQEACNALICVDRAKTSRNVHMDSYCFHRSKPIYFN